MGGHGPKINSPHKLLHICLIQRAFLACHNLVDIRLKQGNLKVTRSRPPPIQDLKWRSQFLGFAYFWGIRPQKLTRPLKRDLPMPLIFREHVSFQGNLLVLCFWLCFVCVTHNFSTAYLVETIQIEHIILLMVQKSCRLTSWGWLLIPLIIGF